MKLGIMQPYFFPYIGYFALINYVDKFVFFDTPQYEPRSWMNRNRILNPDKDFTYITLAVQKAQQTTAIKDIVIVDTDVWNEKLIAQLSVYKKKAPNYNVVIDFIKSLGNKRFLKLSDLNIFTIVKTCEYLEILVEFDIFSKMNLKIAQVNQPDEWALQITKAMGYNIYVNPPGGMSFFDRQKYNDASVELQFLQADLLPYVQRIGRFVEGLSIIDVMMFNSVDEIKKMLGSYKIL